VRQYDFALPDRDALARRYEVEAVDRSLLDHVNLILFANLDPCNKKMALMPIRDWLLDPFNDGGAEYDEATQTLHHYRDGGALADPIHFAIGSDKPITAWQLGREEQSEGALIDAYLDLDDGVLSNNVEASGQVDAALIVPLQAQEGQIEATFYFVLDHDFAEAAKLLDEAREVASAEWLAQTQAWWQFWLNQTRLPDTDNEEIVRTAKRWLISIRAGTDAASGMMVASISSQPPYHVDWPRDGAAMNHALDLAGCHEMVTQHNLYYAAVQEPTGSYWMNYYPDGTWGGPLPLELDADGIITWEIVDHAQFLFEPDRTAYLEAVYPAVANSAEFICFWRNPINKLPLPSFELDSAVPVQTLVSAAAAYAGIKAAVIAGETLDEDEQVLARWRDRRDELREAILEHYYDAEQNVFTDTGYGSTYLIWPAQIFPVKHPAIQNLAQRLYEAQRPIIEMTVEYGSYNGVAMEAIVHAWRDDPTKFELLDEAMTLFMTQLPTPDTHHWGEGWYLVDNGNGPEFENHVAMPHLLTGAYHMIATMKLYGTRNPVIDDDDSACDDDDDTADDDIAADDDDMAADDTDADGDNDDNGCGCQV